MRKYTDIPCVHCQNKFTDDDDVVVCPECGAPHHRKCYTELGHCALESQHSPDFAWQPPVDPNMSAGGTVVCKSCNTVNPKHSNFCQMCGARLEAAPAPDPNHPGRTHAVNEDDANHRFDAADQWEIQGVTAREISTFVGNNAFYYLHQFQALLKAPAQISWNWAAFFFNYLYFFYRKMYAWGTVFLFFSVFTSIPSVIYFVELFKQAAPEAYGVTLPFSQQLIDSMVAIATPIQMLNFAMMLVCGLFANKLYLKKVLSDVRGIKQSFGDRAGSRDYFGALFYRGRVNRTAVIILIAGYFMLSFTLATWLLLMVSPGA